MQQYSCSPPLQGGARGGRRVLHDFREMVLHADLLGSRNIALRTLLVRQDWMSTGVLSASPDVSKDETKAEILQRFSQLRWTLDASPNLADERVSAK